MKSPLLAPYEILYALDIKFSFGVAMSSVSVVSNSLRIKSMKL